MASPYVYDVTDRDFQQKVVDRSREALVVVDFWAPWCAPCRMLGPALERVVTELNGRAYLAKVNVDENPMLARAFRIQSIPAVKLFQGGKLVGEFVGALPESQLRQILSRFLPSESDAIVMRAQEMLRDGDVEGAKKLFEKALASDPKNGAALVGLAEAQLIAGDIEGAKNTAAKVEPGDEHYDAAQAIISRIEFAEQCQKAGGVQQARAKVQQNPHDLDARYDYACCLAAHGKFQEALDEFLEIIKRDKHYRDDAAKNAMVRIFGIVGQRSPLADEYRSKLANILY